MKEKKLKSKDISHSSIPASVGLVQEVRNELKAEIKVVDKKVDSLENRIDSLENKMESKFAEVLVVMHRTQVIVEEQRSENRIVLDGLKTVLDRQDRVEVDVESLKSRVDSLKVRNA